MTTNSKQIQHVKKKAAESAKPTYGFIGDSRKQDERFGGYEIDTLKEWHTEMLLFDAVPTLEQAHRVLREAAQVILDICQTPQTSIPP